MEALESWKEGGINNYYYAPKLNPKYSIDDPIWFCVKRLDSIQNFIVENVYRNHQVSREFRNILHKVIRGNSISRTDIPKYLTNLDNKWCNFEDTALSGSFFELNSDKCFPAPVNIHVAISNRCNLKCVMCPYHSPKYEDIREKEFFYKANFMKLDDFKRIAEYCGKYKVILQFGQLDEPLLHPHFDSFLDIAKEYGVENINLTTNGTLLSQEMAYRIADSNICHVNFSLDAIDEVSYKEIRGFNYVDTIRNIEFLLELLKSKNSKITTSVCFILQNKNCEHKSQEFLKYWIEKVDKVKFHQLTEYELVNGVMRAKYQNSFRGESQSRYPCSIPWKVLFILPDLKVTFCCNSMSEYALSNSNSKVSGIKHYVGDLSRENLDDIWKGEDMLELRRELLSGKFTVFDICQHCPNWAEGELEVKIDFLGHGMKTKVMYNNAEIIYQKE